MALDRVIPSIAGGRLVICIGLALVHQVSPWEEASALPLLDGDPLCWAANGVPSIFQPFFPAIFDWEIHQYPALVQRLCCRGETVHKACWRGGYSWKRCCTSEFKTFFSPVAGRCPEGYEYTPHSNNYDIRNDDSAIGWDHAFDECSKDAQCCGVMETVDETLNEITGSAYFVGNCKPLLDARMKTCHKVTERPQLFDDGQMWKSLRVANACCDATPNIPICLPSLTQMHAAKEVPTVELDTYFHHCPTNPLHRVLIGEIVKVKEPLFTEGCFARAWMVEWTSRFVLDAKGFPRLSPIDLGTFALHFFETQILVPEALALLKHLEKSNSRALALDVCAPAAILATILSLDRYLHKRTPVVFMETIRSLEKMWLSLALPGVGANSTNDVLRMLAPESQVAAEMVQAIGVGFKWIRTQVRKMSRLRRLRRIKGFTVHVVLPICLPADLPSLAWLSGKLFGHFSFRDNFVLFLYDCCFALFQPGSPKYDLENQLEFDLADAKTFELLKSGRIPDVIQDIADHFRQTYIVPFYEEIPTAEIAATLRHFERHYEDSVDYFMALHADALEHVNVNMFFAVLSSLSTMVYPNETELLYMGHRHNVPMMTGGRVGSEPQHRCKVRGDLPPKAAGNFWTGRRTLDQIPPADSTSQSCHWIEHVWEMVFERPFNLEIDDHGGYDFFQLVIRGDSIRHRPREWWGRVWRTLTRKQNYELLPGTRFFSWLVDGYPERGAYHKGVEIVFEHMPHVLLFPGRSNFYLNRHFDPQIPLAFHIDPLNGKNRKLFGKLFK